MVAAQLARDVLGGAELLDLAGFLVDGLIRESGIYGRHINVDRLRYEAA